MYCASKLPQFVFLCTHPEHGSAFQAHTGLKSINGPIYTESSSTCVLIVPLKWVKTQEQISAEAVNKHTLISTHTTPHSLTHIYVNTYRHIEIQPILEIKDKPENCDLDLGGGAPKALNFWQIWLLGFGSSPSLLYWDEAGNKVTWAGVWDGTKAKFNY